MKYLKLCDTTKPSCSQFSGGVQRVQSRKAAQKTKGQKAEAEGKQLGFLHFAFCHLPCPDDWRPRRFGYNVWGCKVEFEFPVVKLLDYAGKEAQLEADANPFATVVLAHLKSLETRRDPKRRHTWKIRLVRGLYERGLDAEQVRQLFLFIDWVLELPRKLAVSFREELHQIEEEKRMPYVSSVERLARREGLLDTIQLGLKLRFGKKGLQLMTKIQKQDDLDVLRAVREAVESAEDLKEIQAILS